MRKNQHRTAAVAKQRWANKRVKNLWQNYIFMVWCCVHGDGGVLHVLKAICVYWELKSGATATKKNAFNVHT